MHIDDLDLRLALEVFAMFCDVHIHVSCIVKTVITPDLLEGVSAFQNVVLLVDKHFQQLSLSCGDALFFTFDDEYLTLFVENNTALYSPKSRFNHCQLRIIFTEKSLSYQMEALKSEAMPEYGLKARRWQMAL